MVSTYTGGLGVGCHVTEGLTKPEYEGSLLLGSHCLDRNIPHMFDLWAEVSFAHDVFDPMCVFGRIRQGGMGGTPDSNTQWKIAKVKHMRDIPPFRWEFRPESSLFYYPHA